MIGRIGIFLGLLAGLSACSDPAGGDLVAAANVGRACTSSDHQVSNFSGFRATELSYEDPSPEFCQMGGCLVENFQGRSDCPAGNLNGEECVTSLGELVTVPVQPQLETQSAEDRMYCSCRCAGEPGPQPLCRCPSGFSCSIDMSTASNTGFSVCARNRREAVEGHGASPTESSLDAL